ncbi:TVP38/TMEM64 family protein [Rhizosaccharibacter radicis]|uniref:TVP38/TMEM64 family membrane protein n=1 Tax=Rhizosaccharibacter radicis TaxID=2782605 RepID=A0ABT1W1E1_9PROT|nr:VTT domain-containing protein [Acetobacteraceae bacterium KSS12]
MRDLTEAPRAMSPPWTLSGGIGRLAKPACFLLGLLAAGLLLRHLHASLPGTAALRDGLGGRALFLLVGSLFCAVGLPRQLVCFAGGTAYGAAAGIVLSTVATVAGCVMPFLWARILAHDWVARRFGTRLGSLRRMLHRRPFASVLVLRLLPVGSSLLLNLCSGALGIKTRPFMLATLLGSLPQTMVFVLLGSGTRFGHDVQTLLAVILFAVSGALGLYMIRYRNENQFRDG